MLRQRLRAARANDEGFTLIELLIVVVVIGVLSGIIVFGVSAFKDEGKKATCQSNQKTVEVAVQAYYAKNGSYTASLAELKSKGFLKSEPAGITIDATDGTVTAAGC
ncbi:pilus assembly protein PilA [Actinoplanes lobatus]|uniref:General secretion pathway protein G n=1 Tax=Actinoplanes lobatus TaxID=113568 RepID=A0A7W7H8Z2_9ACTN|nr:prepilin-type N-terminal cleavage/methylation domain-containing protein [Actinoplanes lobatus]MBB4746226.1 general secretion pathway protein G [Actinoplanes lobatus]GGN61229.1 pilus assembly protein PilA [Actinoplanes lobatus]GIE41434.1 pilus assembly protein PilA [Actinoplanes lobatus]